MAKRFSFDDTIEYDKDDLTPNEDFLPSKKNNQFKFDDNETDDTLKNGDKKLKKGAKKKRKLKIWVIILLVIVVAMVLFLVYIFGFTGNNDGPVYGDRCASMLSIGDEQLAQGEAAIEANENVTDVNIEINCRTIKMTYTFVDNISTDDAMTITESTLHSFDDAIGLNKDDGAAWSQLFNNANGRMQYDVDIILKSNGDAGFPVFGVKHAGVDTITYTTQNVKDQSSADRALQNQAEIDAANQAQGN